jgi:NAD(P)-dependent dehydrogenase (short-subunit alcohol dehydrogenase family)
VLESFPTGGLAVVVGASGGLGAALVERLCESGRFADVLGLGRRSEPPVDLASESSIERAAAAVAGRPEPLRLVIVATGFLHGAGFLPEKSWRSLDAQHLAQAFAVNAIGPALLMKHFLPRLAPKGRSVFAALSARVGSIGDNALGGWYSYRASKAALNQLVRTAAVELRRTRPEAVCVALHPGTVDTALSAPFGKAGLSVQPPADSAARLLQVIDGLTPERSGGFFDHRGAVVPW